MYLKNLPVFKTDLEEDISVLDSFPLVDHCTMICVGAVVMNGCSVLFSDGWSSSKRCIQRLQYSGAIKVEFYESVQ